MGSIKNSPVAYATSSSPSNNRVCGFGSVISRDPPAAKDETNRQRLAQYLKHQEIFENDADFLRRIDALSCLKKVCSRWIRSLYARLGEYTTDQIAKVGGALLTFGSYRLGVHFRGGDIDTVLLAPRRVELEQFFVELPHLLRQQPECESVTPVADAFAPVIKIILGGVEFDLLFCRCMLESVPKQLSVLNIKSLEKFTETAEDLRALNGCRVNDYVLSCVPNVETFRDALRAIKYWAKRRCIYSNKLGYFGGISWALLVAFTCQHYPNANAAMIVRKMFLLFSEWNWPQPVFIRDPRDFDAEDLSNENNLNMHVWDARVSPNDRLHFMPIITPVFPQQNTTFNVQKSQRATLVAEIQRGSEICEKVWRNEAKWEKLFEPLPFFLNKCYLAVIAEAETKELFEFYSGFVESRLRKLVEFVIQQSNVVRFCRAHTRQFEVARASKPTALWLFGLESHKTENGKMESFPVEFADAVQNCLDEMTQGFQLGGRKCVLAGDNSVRTRVKICDRTKLIDLLLPEATINEDEFLKRFAESVKTVRAAKKTAKRAAQVQLAAAAAAAAGAAPIESGDEKLSSALLAFTSTRVKSTFSHCDNMPTPSLSASHRKRRREQEADSVEKRLKTSMPKSYAV